MKNQGTMLSPKDHNHPPVIELNDVICDLANKQFKIAVLRKLSEPQEYIARQFNKIRKRIHIHTKEKCNRGRVY